MRDSSILFTKSQLVTLFEHFETVGEIANFVGCHRNTILRWARHWNIPMKRGPKSKAIAKRSTVGQFFREYQGDIPRTYADLAELSGCTKDALRNYAYRMRKQSKALIQQQPWRNTGRVRMWTDIRGHRIPDKAFDIVRCRMSKFGTIHFEVRLKTGDVHVFRLTSDKLRRMYAL